MENFDQILDAPLAEEKRLQYAGFWIRLGAYLIDAVLLWAINFLIAFVVASLGKGPELIASLISFIINLFYFGIMESSEHQATLGKMAVGIKVGDRSGGQLTLANALGRYLAKIISGITLCIGFIMIGWDEKNQGLHDKLADTYVFYNLR